MVVLRFLTRSDTSYSIAISCSAFDMACAKYACARQRLLLTSRLRVFLVVPLTLPASFSPNAGGCHQFQNGDGGQQENLCTMRQFSTFVVLPR